MSLPSIISQHYIHLFHTISNLLWGGIVSSLLNEVTSACCYKMDVGTEETSQCEEHYHNLLMTPSTKVDLTASDLDRGMDRSFPDCKFTYNGHPGLVHDPPSCFFSFSTCPYQTVMSVDSSSVHLGQDRSLAFWNPVGSYLNLIMGNLVPVSPGAQN